MNLPLELVDKILQYDGRIKYRKGEFVNVIDPKLWRFYRFILDPLLKKKINIQTIGICSINRISNKLSSSLPHDPGFNFG